MIARVIRAEDKSDRTRSRVEDGREITRVLDDLRRYVIYARSSGGVISRFPEEAQNHKSLREMG